MCLYYIYRWKKAEYTVSVKLKKKEGLMAGYLIKDTTKEERRKIVEESLGNIEANCDGCMSGLAEMYEDYIDGKEK